MPGTGDAIRSMAFESIAVREGDHWIYRYSEVLADTATVNVLIENTTSDRIAVNRKISSDAAASGTITQNVTVDTAGTGFEYLATEITDPIKTDAPGRVEHGVTTSGGNGNLPVKLHGGDKGKAGGSGPATGASFVMEPGTNLLYSITSAATDNTVAFEFRVIDL